MAPCWPCISEHLLLVGHGPGLGWSSGLALSSHSSVPVWFDSMFLEVFSNPNNSLILCVWKERDFKRSNINFSHVVGSLGLLTPGSPADIGDKGAFPGWELACPELFMYNGEITHPPAADLRYGTHNSQGKSLLSCLRAALPPRREGGDPTSASAGAMVSPARSCCSWKAPGKLPSPPPVVDHPVATPAMNPVTLRGLGKTVPARLELSADLLWTPKAWAFPRELFQLSETTKYSIKPLFEGSCGGMVGN